MVFGTIRNIYLVGGSTFSKTADLQRAGLVKMILRCYLKILVLCTLKISFGPENPSVNHYKQTLRRFLQTHVFCNKLLYYTISLHLWSETLNATFNDFIVSEFTGLQLATLLRSDSFRRCSSRIHVSLCSGVSRGLMHLPSSMFFDGLLVLNLSLLITGNGMKRCPIDTWVLL